MNETSVELTSEEFEETDIDSRRIFIARLGDDMEASFRVKDILAMLDDCDRLAEQSSLDKRRTTFIQTDFSEGMQYEPSSKS